MKKEELQQLLVDSNIPNDLYSLRGGLPNESFCLNFTGDSWEVYYSERGLKSQLETFESEEEACNYFYQRILELMN